jgi:hypothetical protein
MKADWKRYTPAKVPRLWLCFPTQQTAVASKIRTESIAVPFPMHVGPSMAYLISRLHRVRITQHYDYIAHLCEKHRDNSTILNGKNSSFPYPTSLQSAKKIHKMNCTKWERDDPDASIMRIIWGYGKRAKNRVPTSIDAKKSCFRVSVKVDRVHFAMSKYAIGR